MVIYHLLKQGQIITDKSHYTVLSAFYCHEVLLSVSIAGSLLDIIYQESSI